MRSKPSTSRSSKTTGPRKYRTHSVNCIPGYHIRQKSRDLYKAQLLTLTLVFIIQTLVYAVLVVALFVTQNYAMLYIIPLMMHQIGYVLHCMIESMFVKKHGKKKGNKKKAEVKEEGAFLPLP